MSIAKNDITNSYNMIEQMTQKPVFVQPQMYKVAVQEPEMVSDDEMDLDDEICEKVTIKGVQQECHKLSQQTSQKQSYQKKIEVQYQKSKPAESCIQSIKKVEISEELVENSEELVEIEKKIVDLPVIGSVARGIWRQVTRSSRTIYVENPRRIYVENVPNSEKVSKSSSFSNLSDVHKLDDQDQNKQNLIEESEQDNFSEESDIEDSQEEEDELLEDILEMKKLIKQQHISRAPKYPQVIQESIELHQEDLEASNKQIQNSSEDNYEALKLEVKSILKQKIDQQNYKTKVKSCKQIADRAMDSWKVGNSYLPLRKTLKKIKKSK